MAEQKIRGSIIRAYLNFIRKNWGQDGLDACLRELKLDKVNFKEGTFYDYEVMVMILRWLSSKHGMEKVRLAGKFAIMNLGLISYLVRFISMESMLQKADERYKEGYGFGSVKSRVTGKHAVATMKDVSIIEENCVGWLGAFEGMFALTHTTGTVKKTKCQLKGDPACEYVLEWE